MIHAVSCDDLKTRKAREALNLRETKCQQSTFMAPYTRTASPSFASVIAPIVALQSIELGRECIHPHLAT